MDANTFWLGFANRLSTKEYCMRIQGSEMTEAEFVSGYRSLPGSDRPPHKAKAIYRSLVRHGILRERK